MDPSSPTRSSSGTGSATDARSGRRRLSPKRRERLERVAYVLDDLIRIPGTQRRVGVDALIGLVPGIGDAAGVLVSSYILYEGARLGVTLATLLRMALNIGIEAVVGLIPGLGDLFDFAFKANNRNVRLIERHLAAPEETRRSSRTILTIVAVALTLFILGLIGGSVWLIGALIEALGGTV